jgi:hypothetical protein
MLMRKVTRTNPGLLLYGCVCCMEARSVRLQDLDFDRKQLKVVQEKERPVPITNHFH